ncbi:MAG: hypothetical protein JNM69_07565 [Archangium sp.]|nr:hypothetical protein [Archangium sp.]
MKRLALLVVVASFTAFAGAPTQPPTTTTAPVAKKKSISTAEVAKTLGTSTSFGSGSLGTRGTGSGTMKSSTPTPTK